MLVNAKIHEMHDWLKMGTVKKHGEETCGQKVDGHIEYNRMAS
jgi:hypothetical protein